jgi:hypothetical protein
LKPKGRKTTSQDIEPAEVIIPEQNMKEYKKAQVKAADIQSAQVQKFTPPIHETTNIVNTTSLRQWDEEDAAYLSISEEEQNNVFTASFIQKAVEEYSLVGDYMEEKGSKQRHGLLKTYDFKSSTEREMPPTHHKESSMIYKAYQGACPRCSTRPTRGTCSRLWTCS